MKPDAGARAEARGEATLCGSLGESTGPENASCYARGVDEAHVGEILDMFGMNGRLRGPVVTEVVSEAAQPGADLPAHIRKLAELKNARILTEGEFEVKKHALLKRLWSAKIVLKNLLLAIDANSVMR
jgi:hypothetical protein